MTVDDAPDIDLFPEQCRRLSSDFRKAGQRLARISATHIVSGPLLPPEYPLLRSGKFAIRFYVTKTQDRVIFFFIRQEGIAELLLDAGTQFEVGVALDAMPRPVLDSNTVQFSIRIPNCFLPHLPPDERLRLLAMLGGKDIDVQFFRFERGVIAVNPVTREIAWPLSSSRLAPGDPQYVWPLLAIARNIGFWLREGHEASTLVPVSREALASNSDFDNVQRRLTEAWCEVVNEVEQRGAQDVIPQSPVEGIWRSMMPAYAVDSYRASLSMRLDEAGNVAFRDEDGLFQLLAELEYREEQGGLQASLELKPPDFLLSGPVYEALLDELQRDEILDRLTEELLPLLQSKDVILGSHGATYRDILRAYLQTPREKYSRVYSATVFRIKRGRRTQTKSPDTDLFVMNGPIGNIPQVHLVLKARVIVTKIEEGTRVEAGIVDDSVEVLYCSHQSMPATLSEMSEYFVRLFFQLGRWFSIATT
jgi:hypothetical protein